MSEQSSLSDEELDFIRQLYDAPLSAKALHSPTFTIDGGPLANALFSRLGQHAQLSLEAQLGTYRMVFPLQLAEDEVNNLQLELGAPSIFEDGIIRRPWRLGLPQPLALLDEHGVATSLRVNEITPGSLLLTQAGVGEPPEQFCLWLPLPGHEPMLINGLRTRLAGPQQAAYRLLLNHREHRERLRQFVFEQYRQRHPQLQIAG